MTAAASDLMLGAELRRTGAGVTYHVDQAHSELVLNLVLAGRGSYFIAGGHLDLRPGALVWIMPNERHRLLRSPDLDMWVVTVPPRAVDSVSEVIDRSQVQLLSSDDALALDRLFAHVSQDSDEPELYEAGLFYAVRLARHVTLTTAGPARKPLHPAVAQALAILRNAAEPPGGTALANACGVSPAYLGQLLMEQTGRGLTEWRNRIRLERFHSLYPQRRDLLTAALDAGFGSYTQFHRVFCDLVGTTPGDWAKSAAGCPTLTGADRTLQQLDAGGTRMIWYALADVTFSAARAWASAFAAPAPAISDETSDWATVPSGFESVERQERMAAILCEEYGGVAAYEAKVTQAFARNDILGAYQRWMVLPFQLDRSDLASTIGAYIAICWCVANRKPFPNQEEVRLLISQVRAILARTDASRRTARERELADIAFIAQMMFLRNAGIAAFGSGDERVLQRVVASARDNALATLGVDLKRDRLHL